MIRQITMTVSSSHAQPEFVNWAVYSLAWRVGGSQESVLGEGSFRVPAGGLEAVLREALERITAAVCDGPI